jgi:hypothetical protein
MFITSDLPIWESVLYSSLFGLWASFAIVIAFIGIAIYFYYYGLRVAVLDEAERLVFRLDQRL